MAAIEWFVRGLSRRGDEVVEQVDHVGGPLDLGKVSDALEDFEPVSWPAAWAA
jgi:hypothetical protein